MSKMSNKLKDMKKRWNEGKDKVPGVPQGEYIFRLQKAEVAESQTSGNLMVKREHLVVAGEYAGEVVRDNQQLETDNGPFFVAKWVESMGYEPPEDIEDLPAILEEMTSDAPLCKGRVSHSGDFTNVRIEGAVDESDVDEELEEEYGEEEEEPEDDEEEEESDDEEEESDDEEEDDEEEEESDDEEEESDDEEEEVEVNVGDIITWEYKGKEKSGTVVADIDEKGSFMVKGHTNNRKTRVNPEDITDVQQGEEESEESEEDQEKKQQLVEFCHAVDFDIDEDQTLADMVEELKGYEIDRSGLTEDEDALLVEFGVLEPAKKAPAKKAPAKKAPAKKAPAKSAAKGKKGKK